MRSPEQKSTPTFSVEVQISYWLLGVSVDQKLLPVIRGIYQSEIMQAASQEKKICLADLKKQSTQLKEDARLGRLFVSGKISGDAYGQSHGSGKKLRNVELSLAEMEREPKTYLNNLDIALVLLIKIGKLYPRLDDK